RLAARRHTDLDRVRKARFPLRRRGDRIARVIGEAGVVGTDENGERPTGRLEVRLVHLALDDGERSENGGVDLVLVRLAFGIDERPRRKVDGLAGRGFAAWRLSLFAGLLSLGSGGRGRRRRWRLSSRGGRFSRRRGRCGLGLLGEARLRSENARKAKEARNDETDQTG